MNDYIMLGLLGVLLNSICQVLLKISANRYKDSGLKIFLNIFTMSGYSMLIIVTIINLYIFKYLDLKFAIILMPLSIILVIILSKLLLSETLEKNKIIGLILIVAGIIIFNLEF